jgi:hypothetical protein
MYTFKFLRFTFGSVLYAIVYAIGCLRRYQSCVVTSFIHGLPFTKGMYEKRSTVLFNITLA